MTTAEFWAIIDGAGRDASKLRAALEELSREDLLSFYREYMGFARELREPPFKNENTNHQEELTWYVVGQGKAAYDAVIAHPETFPTKIGRDGARNFVSDIVDVYAERFDEEIMEADMREP